VSTQRDRALQRADEIRKVLSITAPHLLVLRNVLDEAQNEPPGTADGSLMALEWNELTVAIRKLDEALWAFEMLRQETYRCGLCRRSFVPKTDTSCRTMCPDCLAREKK